MGFQGVGFRLLAGLHFRHSFFRWPRGWLLFAGTQVAVDGPLAERRGVDPEAVAASAERRLERHPAIAEVWNPREIREGESEMARLYRTSFDPERSGNLVVQVAEGCMISTYPSGTTHGSPWGYDRRVPLVFWGAGVEPGRVPGPARPVDVAPTLAPRLGVEPPPDLDGRRLF